MVNTWIRQDGKWSHIISTCVSPPDTVPVIWYQNFEEGRSWPFASYDEAWHWFTEHAPGADRASFEALLRAEWPEEAHTFDANAAAIDGMSVLHSTEDATR